MNADDSFDIVPRAKRKKDSKKRIRVLVKFPNNTLFEGFTHDISLSGVYVRCDELQQYPWFRVGQAVELDIFNFEDLDNIQVQGEIVRVVDDSEPGRSGFGVQFLNLTVDAYNKLCGLIELAARLSAEPPPLPGSSEGR